MFNILLCSLFLNGPLAMQTVAQAADTATTLYGLSLGCEEMNPLLPKNAAGIVAVKSGLMVASAWATHRIQKRHPKLALGLSVVLTVVGSVAVTHNLRVIASVR